MTARTAPGAAQPSRPGGTGNGRTRRANGRQRPHGAARTASLDEIAYRIALLAVAGLGDAAYDWAADAGVLGDNPRCAWCHTRQPAGLMALLGEGTGDPVFYCRNGTACAARRARHDEGR